MRAILPRIARDSCTAYCVRYGLLYPNFFRRGRCFPPFGQEKSSGRASNDCATQSLVELGRLGTHFLRAGGCPGYPGGWAAECLASEIGTIALISSPAIFRFGSRGGPSHGVDVDRSSRRRTLAPCKWSSPGRPAMKAGVGDFLRGP